MSDFTDFFAWATKERGTTFKHLAGEHDQSTHGHEGGSGDIVKNTDAWRKGTFSPRAWHEVEANKGDKFMLTGKGDEPLMEMQVTKADPYRRFPVVKITKIVNPHPNDMEVAQHFLDRENGGEIALMDADVKYFKPIRRAKKQ